MKLIDVYTKLRELKLSVLQTRDVAAILKISVNHANKLLSRLSEARHIVHLRRGTWIFPDIDPLALPSLLTEPFPAYVSLQTALFYHGMVSQIPSIIYAVSPARTRLYKTPIASISIHHVQPLFFFGYDEIKDNELLKIATPEKALIDIFYLSQTKSRLFHSLPEIELPKKFKLSMANKIIDKITSVRKKTLVRRRFSELIEEIKSHR
jgi:predicted transcriptional regulator of viral defense system